MKKIVLLLALGFVPAAVATEIVLSVNGLVCAFCANGIAATAERHPAVAEVTVDLDNALARFVVKAGATLDADGAKKIIDQAGYEAAAVTLIDQSTSANLTRLATLAGVPLPAPATSAYLVEGPSADGRTRLHARLTLERAHADAWLAPTVPAPDRTFTVPGTVVPLGWTPGDSPVRQADAFFGGRPALIAIHQPDDHTTVLYLEISL